MTYSAPVDVMPEWFREASCAGMASAGRDPWFPGSSGRMSQHQRNAMYALALQTCDSCPVRRKCLEWAITRKHIPFGIWGGVHFSNERSGKLASMFRISLMSNTLAAAQDAYAAMPLASRVHKQREET